MRKAIPIALAVAFLFACQGEKSSSEPPVRHFHTDVMLPFTPVKEQGEGDACWIYAMLATIESEHLRYGDSINLSPTFLCRHALAEQARRRYATNGKHHLSLRGMAPMALQLMESHGAMPYNSYHRAENVDYKGLSTQLTRMADSSRAHLKGVAHLDQQASRLLDDAMGFTPSWVFMLGCQYTPMEFARSICKKDEYVALTSFTHHPFGEKFALEVPDNQYHCQFLNIPLDSLMGCITRALSHGHPVCWEGDITEPGFDAEKGTGELNSNAHVTQKSRQRDFDHLRTTDDHCMEMVGIAHDEHQQRYFICKNSWGKNNAYAGFIFLSEEYVRAKTICIVLSKDAI
ncbi:MAG: cysteine protease [Prevotella sp.]|nr:cysteine protease [Prevotella sp.]